MLKSNILQNTPTLSFSDYFKLGIDAETVTQHFGFQFEAHNIQWQKHALPAAREQDIFARISEILPYIRLNNEMARREFLIAPILMEIVRFLHIKIWIELNINSHAQLQGNVDYVLENAKHQTCLVIEAKNADLERGFGQLASELIGLSLSLAVLPERLYGAVSIGNIWQFAYLDLSQKKMYQDLNLYRIPTDLSDVLGILVGMLH